MQPSIARALCVGLLSFLSAGAVQAQELTGSFDQLRVLVKTGDTIHVTDRTGRDIRGSVAGISASSIALTAGGSRHTFVESEIDNIRQRRSDPLSNGAKWGFAAGAGLGLLAGVALSSEYEGSSGTAIIPILALAYGGIGAGVGAGIDALHSSEQVIFARRGPALRVSVRW